jgi:endonuclease/exonuclease/phosphatase family metal-dependent hydrolase
MGASLLLVGLAATVLSFSAGVTLGAVKTPAQPMQPLDQPALRAMSFNVRVNTSSDGENDWSHRRELVPATIRFHQADVVGVQEAYRGMIGDMQARLPGYAWYGVGTSDGKEEGAFNPVFWRESRLELVSGETFWLSPTPETPSSGWDAAFPRTATHIVLRECRSGTKLHVFNTHLDHEGEQARLESARLLSRRIRELPAAARVILLGDFNCSDGSPPLRALTGSGRLRDARDVSATPHYGPTGSFTGFAGPQYSGPLLDHIFVRGLAVQQHGILPDHFDGRLPSDHFPVLAEILLQ